MTPLFPPMWTSYLEGPWSHVLAIRSPAVSAVNEEHGGHEDDVADGEDGEADKDAARARGGVGTGLEAGAACAAVAEPEAFAAAAAVAPHPAAAAAGGGAERVGGPEERAGGEEGLQLRGRRARLWLSPRLTVDLRPKGAPEDIQIPGQSCE